MNSEYRVIAILILGLLVSGCSNSSSKDSLVGLWTQSVVDESNHITGTENLELGIDGKLVCTNDLCYAEKNDFFDVNIKFTVSIDGNWEYEGGKHELKMNFDTDSFSFDLESGESGIAMAGDGNAEEFEKIKGKMIQDLSAYLRDMYSGYYEKLSPGGLILTNVKASQTALTGEWNGYSVAYVRSNKE